MIGSFPKKKLFDAEERCWSYDDHEVDEWLNNFKQWLKDNKMAAELNLNVQSDYALIARGKLDIINEILKT